MQETIESSEKIEPQILFEKDSNINGAVCEELKYNDTDVAIRFVKHNNTKMFYYSEKKKWYMYDGMRFTEDKHNKITKLFEEFLDNEAKYIIDNYTNGTKQRILYENNKYRNNSKKQAALLQSIRKEIIKTTDEIDRNVCLFNVENGIVKLLEDGDFEFVSHSPDYLITQLAPIKYNHDAPNPINWLKFIDLITLGDKDVAMYLQKYFGYCLTGSVSEQVFIFLFGPGKNGKSTLTITLKRIFGDYAANVNFTSFTRDRNNSAASSDLARLDKKRLVITDEAINNDQRYNSSRAIIDARIIKSITGGDKLVVRRMYGEETEMQPTYKVVLFGNSKLEFNDFSEGMQRRFKQIPLLHKFNNPRSMDDIQKIFWEEAPGILNWLLEGYSRWKKEGLNAPRRIEEETAELFLSQNNVLSFISEKCDKTNNENGSKLFKAYIEYCEENDFCDQEILRQRKFYSQLESFGFNKRKAKPIYFVGISLK